MSLRERKPATSVDGVAATPAASSLPPVRPVPQAKAPRRVSNVWIAFSVVVSYVIVSIITMVFFLGLHVASQGKLTQYNVSTALYVVMMFVGVVAAAAGGLVSVLMSRSRKTPRILGLLMTALGLVNMYMTVGKGEPIWFQVILTLIPYPTIMWVQRWVAAQE